MVLGGLWHGASENFVIWGAMNGIALILYKVWPYFDTCIVNCSEMVIGISFLI